MKWKDYIEPIELERLFPTKSYQENQLGSKLLQFDDEELNGYDIVIFDVAEDRAADNLGSAEAAKSVREYLYSLYEINSKMKVADLGTIKQGDKITDTYFAVQECMSYFLKKNVIPVMIGGGQDLALANYRAYADQEQLVNFVSIDSRLNLGNADDPIHASNYLSKILLQQPNILFNYSNLGYQTYLVEPKAFSLLDDMFYDIHRLGVLKGDMKLAEPVIRNADFVSFNMAAIAQPFSPANINASPNGFTGEEACQLARYAGINDKLSSIGFYELNPNCDLQGMSAHLLAQMIWYFIDGFYQRKTDFPACNKNEYIKYTVAIDDAQQEMVFYKSPKSNRWWVEVPYHANFRKKYERHLMLPCNYEDYQTAMENEIPERWFQTFQKLK